MRVKASAAGIQTLEGGDSSERSIGHEGLES